MFLRSASTGVLGETDLQFEAERGADVAPEAAGQGSGTGVDFGGADEAGTESTGGVLDWHGCLIGRIQGAGDAVRIDLRR